ncbi:MAG TPA: metallophosphoesterase, partial [Propionibacteriaceae bacterium]|nr:metallophosphoesterase [Propionibacteriaceae bacterium]
MVSVLHVSDTHLRADDRRLRGVDPRERLASVLEAVVREGFVPDLVIHGGDIADDESVVGAQLAFDAMSALGGRVLGVPGNHDLPASVAQVFTTTDADLPGWRVIGLDTVIEGRVGGTVEGRLDRLADALAADVPLIVVMHHP